VGVLAFVLAAWSLVDFVRYRRTRDTKKVTLGLPKSVKARIHKVIRAGLRTRNLLIGSLTVGFLVSVLESLCTGQVYLPTIMFVTRSPDLRTRAIGFLLLYNVMFILNPGDIHEQVAVRPAGDALLPSAMGTVRPTWPGCARGAAAAAGRGHGGPLGQRRRRPRSRPDNSGQRPT